MATESSSILGTVKAVLPPKILVKLTDNPVDFVSNVVKKHCLPINVSDDQSSVVISGEIGAINEINNILLKLYDGHEFSANFHVEDSKNFGGLYNSTMANTRKNKRNSLSTIIKRKQPPISKVLKCGLCIGTFKTELGLARHRKIHRLNNDENKLILCGLCDRRFKNRGTLKEHIKNVHFQDDLKRTSKPDHFKGESVDIFDGTDSLLPEKITMEMNREKGSASLHCAYCDYVGKTHASTHQHERRCHITELRNDLVCTSCGKVFGMKKDLRRHYRCHAEPTHKCTTCGKLYRHEKHMLDHAKTHESGYVAPRVACSYCDKSFCNKFVMQMHTKAEHLGGRLRYLCQTCGKTFAQKVTYQQHVNVHLGVKPFVCDTCGAAFSYRKSLKDHALRHSEERKYSCDVCFKTFKQSSGLAIHRRIHSETRDHVCTICNRSFTQKHSLKRHTRVHLGTKPYSCRICHEMFSDVSIVRRHLLLVHKRTRADWKAEVHSVPTADDKASQFFVEPKISGDMSNAGIEIALLNSTNSTTAGLLCGFVQPIRDCMKT